MKTNNLGYPRIGSNRELKWASEKYWAGKISLAELQEAAKAVRAHNWELQKAAGIDIIPSNDFSFYDQVLDMTLTVGAIPERYHDFVEGSSGKFAELDLYFAMARGYQRDKIDVPAMEMLKWFDTNYHYIVPEFKKGQSFHLKSTKIFAEFDEAKALGIVTKPVIIGPVSYLMLGREKDAGFHRISLLEKLLPIYVEILQKLESHGAEWVQLDEPYLALDIDQSVKAAFKQAYAALHNAAPKLKVLVATYFDKIGDNLDVAASLPVQALHIDLVRAPTQLDEVLAALPGSIILSVGVVDGRNVWKNDFSHSLDFIKKATAKLGNDRVLIGPSCSLALSPCDLDLESNEKVLSATIKNWMAFAKQKIAELATLKTLAAGGDYHASPAFKANQEAQAQRKSSPLIHKDVVQQRIAQLTEKDASRGKPFSERKQLQQKALHLPAFPTTTIGSFPQTPEVRQWRAQWRKGEMSQEQYDKHIKEAIEKTIRWQENVGLDVLVHGEFERTDMVEYFGEQLHGFTFTQNGWVQSYGSRCVKPPVIFGDVERTTPMTVHYTKYAQSLTPKPVKGMLTGPVTILQWSFVRNDQPRSTTCTQIACAIRDEVKDLETAGTKVIQIDEPAIREGLPLRKADWKAYLEWAVRAFRISASAVHPETQIHTHMCYSEFNDIIQSIADMDADVITIECSRSQMKLLQAFGDFRYPNDIGPGVYDIHSPRVPHLDELLNLLHAAEKVVPPAQLWVNPDCGLKTRGWEETEASLKAMVEAANVIRKEMKA